MIENECRRANPYCIRVKATRDVKQLYARHSRRRNIDILSTRTVERVICTTTVDF